MLVYFVWNSVLPSNLSFYAIQLYGFIKDFDNWICRLEKKLLILIGLSFCNWDTSTLGTCTMCKKLLKRTVFL